MFSRLTAIAMAFAVLATASLAVTASVHQEAAAHVAVKPAHVIQLERVVVLGKRLAN